MVTIAKKETIYDYVRDIILKHYPYVTNRLDCLMDALEKPECDIIINIDKESHIMFLIGNQACKTSIDEQGYVSYIISFEEISEIIDFILNDHEVIKNIDINNIDNGIDLVFGIDWNEDNIFGIYCGDIGLKLRFKDSNLRRKYLYLLVEEYRTYLENTPSYNSYKNEYINKFKELFLKSSNKEDLINLISKMNEEEIKKLLSNLDNDLFIKYVKDNKEKEYILKNINN